ncbi:MAG: TIGR03619 family F420-dependent LLM class oxidoreductase [Chloroflexi bacterium]|nr:TIGR03619 family F420-dependent LLM class oxidoreductase [Chloroflexota bacterium]
MKIGVVFPQTEFGNDPAAIRDYAQTAEALGYTHILAYDHVLGANPRRTGGWQGPYTHEDPFHEPFVLFSYMAGITERIKFVTGILILPQRETAVVAKQAASLDVLSNGRLRLGVGIGWNQVEYVALNQAFGTRGKRIEEQVALLRQLWTKPLVNFDGHWHTIPDAGINPLPVQRPIPIWFGGHADAVLRRTANIGDGWLPNYRKAEDAAPSLDKLDAYLVAAGRSRKEIGLEARIHSRHGNLDTLLYSMEAWKSAGATHISLNTMGAGYSSPEQHLQRIQSFATVAIGT